MKKNYSIRIEESVYYRILDIWGNFIKGLDILLKNYITDKIKATESMEYPEMVWIFKDMAEFLKKYKPWQEFGIAHVTDEPNWNLKITAVKKNKLQAIADGVKVDTTKSDYHSLYNSLTPTRKQQLTDIVNATKKWNYREDSVEYTRNELLEKRWFSEFIGLI